MPIKKTGQIGYQLENHSSELSSDHSLIILDTNLRLAKISPSKPINIANWKNFEAAIEEADLS